MKPTWAEHSSASQLPCRPTESVSTVLSQMMSGESPLPTHLLRYQEEKTPFISPSAVAGQAPCCPILSPSHREIAGEGKEVQGLYPGSHCSQRSRTALEPRPGAPSPVLLPWLAQYRLCGGRRGSELQGGEEGGQRVKVCSQAGPSRAGLPDTSKRITFLELLKSNYPKK